MTYKINGTEIPTQPTTGHWMPRKIIGIDGNGHAIYTGVREFTLKWQLLEPNTADQLQSWFEGVGNTGTAVVDLPYYISGSYSFYSYTGCVLREPEFGVFFTENYKSVNFLITNINT